MRNLTACLLVAILAFVRPNAAERNPEAQGLIERHAKEKSPVWADGDDATFFFRGDAEKVTLLIGGGQESLRRLPGGDVWTVTLRKKDLQKGVFSYAIVPHKSGVSPHRTGQKLHFETWRGPQAPPAPARAAKLQGTAKAVDFDSAALGEKRKVHVYVPPGHDPKRTYAVVYATDGQTGAEVLEPLIHSGRVRPVVVVGSSSGPYLGDPDKGPWDSKKDVRTMEYVPGMDNSRFARHEKFFVEELSAWAERGFGASQGRADRAVFGCSNGARFAIEMGLRHADRFAHVLAFSSGGGRVFTPPPKAAVPSQFYLAAGTWEEPFFKSTESFAEKFRKQGVPVEFHPRVSGHDDGMWQEEFSLAIQSAFPSAAKTPAPATSASVSDGGETP